MSLCAINDRTEQQLMVIWDLGRRCTFSCSYCPPHRQNNWSQLASFEELCTTADTVERYSEIYNQHRNRPFRVNASFTGGEPTVNPAFFTFLEYLQAQYPHWYRTLTTNGFYSDRRLKTVMANTDFTTVSYHCEATAAQKAQVMHNLGEMYESGYNFDVNIMFHQREDYFEECQELAEWCDEYGIKYTPRVIGDQENVKQGVKDKTVHEYTPAQMQWLKGFWEQRNAGSLTPARDALRRATPPSSNEMQVGQKIGRPCCGGRKMEQLVNSEWTTSTFVENNNFQGWNCMVNWYFLYIHQEIGKVWHHQTCMVNLEGEVAPICDVQGFDQYCDQLEAEFATGSIPFIRCPKTYCGCGLCVPKARHENLSLAIFKEHAPSVQPVTMTMKTEVNNGSLKRLVDQFDKANNDV